MGGGGVLLQKGQNYHLHPCAYVSRKFNATEKNWSIWDKKAAAIKLALTIWKHLLERARVPFELWTDHKNLEAFHTWRKLRAKQFHWDKLFSKFRVTLRHLMGKKIFGWHTFTTPATQKPTQCNSRFIVHTQTIGSTGCKLQPNKTTNS